MTLETANASMAVFQWIAAAFGVDSFGRILTIDFPHTFVMAVTAGVDLPPIPHDLLLLRLIREFPGVGVLVSVTPHASTSLSGRRGDV